MGWLSGWAKRIKLTIDYTLVDSNLTDFPVMLKITDESVFDEILSADDRYKIAITASDGTTQCYVEVERWDQINKLAILHTIISSVSSTADTIIYLYYDSGHVDNTDYVGDTQIEDSNYVWMGDSFEAVFHMAQSPAGTVLDSGLMGNNAASGGGMVAGDLVDGLVGKAIDFDGQDDRLDLLAAISLSGAFSISILGKITSYALGPGIACNGTTWASGRIAIKASADALWLGSADTVSLTEALPTDTWFLLTITRDGSNNIKVYKNGADITSGSPTFSGTLSIDRICDNPDNVTQKAWCGPIDEFRISSSCLSADWIKATYYSLINELVKARDCGESWTDLGQQFSQLWIPGLIYLGGGIALAGTYDGGKILRSTNYGANWSDLGQQASQTIIRPFAYCGNGIVLAGTANDGKILRSTNYGANWSDLGQQASQSYILSLAYLESGIALAGTNPGGKILRSTNYGANWTDLGTQFSQYNIYALVYLGDGIVLAGTHPGGKILRSANYGATWQDLGQQASQKMIIRLVYLGNGIVLAGTGTAADYETAVIDTQQGTLRIATVAGGALFWDTGQDFSPYVGAAGAFKPYALIATDSGAKTAWGYIGEEGTGETLGSELITNGDFTNWTADNPDNWALNFTETGSTYVTENPAGQCQLVKGDSTNPHIFQVSIFTTGKLYKVSFDIKSISGTLQFYNGSYIVNYTTSGIKTFYMTATAPNINFLLEVNGNATIDDVSVKEVTALPADQGIKIYSTKTGSTQSWADVESGFDANDISSYEVRQVVSDGHILRSTDYGLTWADLGQQVLQKEIRSLAYCGDGIALAGTYPNGKILRSTDYGQTWTDLGTQASQGQICSMAYCEDGIALAGTGPNGKILRSVADILRAEEQSIYPVPAAELAFLPKHPIMIPFYIPIPAATMSLFPQDPSWVWDINRMYRITYTLKLILGTSVTIPISSFQCRTKQIPASIIYNVWEAGATYYPLSSYVIPTTENGYYYRCIGSIQVWDPNNPLVQAEPDWPTKKGVYVCDGKYYWRRYAETGIVYSVALSAVIPDISWAAEVTARSTGVIKIYQNFHFTNGQTQTHLLIRALAERITIDEYAKSGRITLYGYEIRQNIGSKRVNLSGQSYRRLDGGKLRYRCNVNPFLLLGDRADINDELFYVNEINYIISPREQIMEISE